MGSHDQDYKIGVDYKPVQYRDPSEATFKGLVRADGRVGTRNYIALCSTVNCSATVIRMIADRVNHSGMLDALPAHRRRDCAVARHRLRHGRRRRRLRQSGAGALGLCHAPERRRSDLRRARLRGHADQPAEAQIRLRRGSFPHADDPGIGRHTQSRRKRPQDDRGVAAHPPCHPAHRRSGKRADGGTPVRRLRRLFRRHRQSGARPRRRHPGRVRRHVGARRDAGNLRRRAASRPPRGVGGGRRRSSSTASAGGRTTPAATRAT